MDILNLTNNGKRGIIRNALRISNGVWSKLRKPKHKYYVRADWEYTNKRKRKRRIDCRFDCLAFLDYILEDYSVVLSSWYDSYSAVHGFGDNTQRTGTSFQDSVEQFLSHVRGSDNFRAVVLRNISPIPSSTFLQERVDMVFVKLGIQENSASSFVNSMAGGVYVFCRFAHGIPNDPYTGGTYSVDGTNGDRGYILDDTKDYSNCVVFKVRDHAISSFGNLDSADSNHRFALKDFHYIRADIPADYDEARNNQLWLPLLDSESTDEPFYTTHAGPMSSITASLWAVGFNRSQSDIAISNGLSADCDISARFIGEVYNEQHGFVRSDTPSVADTDLFNYELTTDAEFLGKGKIYVDADNVCYCPLTGFPLYCDVDFRPEAKDFTGYCTGVC